MDAPARTSATTSSEIKVTSRDGVTIIGLDRPKHANGLDYASGRALLDAVTRATRDDEVRAIVLTGHGGVFCAGDDLGALERYLDGEASAVPASRDTGNPFYIRVCEALLSAPKPVVAAVSGVAMGPGVELACAADLRVGGPGTRMGCGLVRAGHSGVAALLQRVLGPSRTTELYLTGRLMSAEEALRAGLLHRLTDRDDAIIEEATELAVSLAAGPTRAIGLFKELRERIDGHPARCALRLQGQFHQRSWDEVDDSTEGIRAILEHRRPRFTGR
ncbi:enoyl-CoA hydratase/isomerase family protein [Amycolatopsis thermoflava]|uniref:enoyl-CoA hydratase/isomerase family protein n=1 Tax=Amycolatopsis thermoflava TaxID=84480 RepID=UPI0037F2CCF0